MTDNNSTLQYEGFEEEPQPTVEPPKGGGNRTFLAAIGILGGIFVIAVIALVAFAAFILPERTKQRNATQTAIYLHNAATAVKATEVAFASLPTATLPPTETPIATPTPVVVIASKTPTPTEASAATLSAENMAKTATVSALLTQAAGGKATPTATPAMPNTGIGDDYALPGLMGAALLLVVVIFVARRLRLTTH